ncbi:hypothetical protein Plhal710r2_c058g0167681 [Plasmopara halstedii]
MLLHGSNLCCQPRKCTAGVVVGTHLLRQRMEVSCISLAQYSMTGRVLDFYLPFRTGRVALCNARCTIARGL